jgi:hypothetical protein
MVYIGGYRCNGAANEITTPYLNFDYISIPLSSGKGLGAREIF